MTFKLPTRRFWVSSLTLLGAVSAAGMGFQSRYRLGIDPQQTLSMDARVFVVDIKDRKIERGKSYVFSVRNASPVYEDGTEMVKRAVGLPGDVVRIDEYFSITVNGRPAGQGLWHLQNQDMRTVRERFTGTRVLGEDEYWMMGLSVKSFDSRYFGPVRSEQIRGRAYGLL